MLASQLNFAVSMQAGAAEGANGDDAVVRALPLFISGAGSIFTGIAEGWVSGGVTAPTQFSTLNAASILASRVPLNLARVWPSSSKRGI